MNAFVSVFVGFPAAFALVAVGALAAFTALATWPAPARGQARFDAAFCAVTVLTLFAWRWPVFFATTALNVDEAQMIANALKATVDLVPWRGFDGTTSGPLNSDVLALAALAGAHIDFFSARVIGLALIAGALCALYFAARWTYGVDVARIALVPPVLLFACVRDGEFVHYSSEHLPIFLTTLALAAAAYLFAPWSVPRGRVLATAVGGACIGAVPFAKLQVLPLAAVGAAYLAAAIVATRRAPGARPKAELATSVVAFAVPVAVILGATAAGGAWSDFVVSYLRAAAQYVSLGAAAGPVFFVRSVPQYTAFLGGVALAVSAGAALYVVRRPPATAAMRAAGISSFALLASALFAIYEPHRTFPHYLLFSVIPLAWCAANALGLAASTFTAGRFRRWAGAVLATGAALLALGTLATTPDAFLKDLAHNATWPQSAVALAVERYAQRGDSLVMWGWMPQYYVETGTIMATRDAHTEHEIDESPLRPYFRERFLRDLTAHPPRVIVDAVAPRSFAYTDSAAQGIEAFPSLAAFARERYTLVADVGGVRVFRLREARR